MLPTLRAAMEDEFAAAIAPPVLLELISLVFFLPLA
jgi:hypothetical protein